jgi:Tfp pilus assembly pilus retraction ATPase PilT
MALLALQARFVDPQVLRATLATELLEPGLAFSQRFEPEAFVPALRVAAAGGALTDVAACALRQVVLHTGEPAGALDFDGEDEAPRRLEALLELALGAPSALLGGGLEGAVGPAGFELGAAPTAWVAAQLTSERRAAVRARLQGGWDEDLLNLLDGARVRAERKPGELLVFVPQGGLPRAQVPTELAVDAVRRSSEARFDLSLLLDRAQAMGASDVLLSPGEAIVVRTPAGVRYAPAVDVGTCEALVEQLLSPAAQERLRHTGAALVGVGLSGVGRVRVSVTSHRGAPAVALRLLGEAPPSLPPWLASALEGARAGLVVLASTPGQGRSSALGAALQQLSARSLAWASLEEPLGWPVQGQGGCALQAELDVDQSLSTFTTAVRTLPVDAVALDLVDDDAAAGLALEAAADGRLVLLTLRAASAAAALQRLQRLDAPFLRRRLATHLALVAWLEREVRGELLRPDEALRRHVKAQEAPAPPVLFEETLARFPQPAEG